MWGREDAAAAVQQAKDDAYDKALFAKQSAEKQAAKELEASKGEACSTYERDIYACASAAWVEPRGMSVRVRSRGGRRKAGALLTELGVVRARLLCEAVCLIIVDFHV